MFWQPKGAAMRNVIENFWKELHIARGYDMLYTPHIAKADLWKTSGHYDFYGENMYDQMQVCGTAGNSLACTCLLVLSAVQTPLLMPAHRPFEQCSAAARSACMQCAVPIKSASCQQRNRVH